MDVKPPPTTTTRLPTWPGIGQAEGRDAQVLQAVQHALGILARDAQLVGVVAADGHADGIEALVLEVADREVLAQLGVADQLDTQVPGALVLRLEHLHLGQAVLRDAVAEHAAGCGVTLEDGHLVTRDGEVVGGSHACRPGADDRGPLAAGGLDLERHGCLHARGLRLEHLVARVAVAVADGDGLFHLIPAAVLLAGRGAHAAEDAREGDGALEDARGLDERALRVCLQETRDIDVAGALVLAGRQAVGVVVAEDQLQVGLADLAQPRRLGLDDHPRLGIPGAADGRRVLALDLDDAHAAGPEARQLGLVAQGRHLDAVVAADLEDGLADATGQGSAIDLEVEGRRDLASLGALGRQQPLGDRIDRLGAAGGKRVGHRTKGPWDRADEWFIVSAPPMPPGWAGRRRRGTSPGRYGPGIPARSIASRSAAG